MRLLVEGRRPKEISQLLGIKGSTVRSHLKAVTATLGSRTLIYAVAQYASREESKAGQI